MMPDEVPGAKAAGRVAIPLSILLAFLSLLFPIVLRWLKILSPTLDQPMLLMIAVLILPVVWLVSVIIAADRVGWKRSRWLWLLTPIGAAWPLAFIWLFVACIVGRECI